MTGFHRRPLPSHVLALAVVLLSWTVPFTYAEEPGAQTKPGEARAAEEPGAQTKPAEGQGKETTAGGGSTTGQQFDQAVVSAGTAAFERSCTKCHDASRSLERTKDL